MRDRYIRRASAQIVEEALFKTAVDLIQAPTLASLKAKKTRELGISSTASAQVPKLLSVPST